MSYWPAGIEAFDSDSDDFEDDGYDYGPPPIAVQPGRTHQTTTPSSDTRMPAGPEDGDSSDDEGIYFSSSRTQSSGSRETAVKLQHESQHENRPKWPPKPVGTGGRGRGRGGFAMPPARSQAVQPGSTRSTHKDQSCWRETSVMMMDELKVAIANANSNAVMQLLDQGAPVDGTFRSGWTSLMHAGSSACPELVDLLVKRGANVNFQKDMYSVLMATCAASGDVENNILHCVETLLTHGAKVNVYDRYRMTPFMYAAREGRLLVCERLLKDGAEINKQDMRGWTALSWAASRGHGRLIRVLLDHHADVKIYTNDGQSPVDIAYSSGYTSLADVLDAVLTGTHRKLNMPGLPSSHGNLSFDKCDDLQLFLRGLDLAHLLPTFQDHKVTFDDLLKLTQNDLAQMGVTQVGVQSAILSAVRDVHKKEWDTTGLQTVNKDTLSGLEAISILANVAKHLSFVRSSTVYVSKHLANVQQGTVIMQGLSQADGLEKFSKEAAQIADSVSEQLGNVQQQVQRISLEMSRKVPDLVTHPPATRGRVSKRVAVLVLGAVMFAGGFLLVKKASE